MRTPPPAHLAWGGVGALASVLVLVLLFTQVLGRFGSHTSSLVPTPLPTHVPTASPVVVYANTFISPDQAWGKGYALAVPNDNADYFDTQAIFPDGSKIVGTVFRNNLQSVVLYDIHSLSMQTIYTAPPDLVTPFNVQTDGRYVIWTGGNVGEAAKSNHNITGFADLQTGRVNVSDAPNNPAPLPQGMSVVTLADGYFLGSKDITPNGSLGEDNIYSVTNLAAGVTRPLSFVGNDWLIGAINWPYILFSIDPHPPQAPTGWKLYNALTNQLTDAPGMNVVPPDAEYGYGIITLSGTTVFWLRFFTTTESTKGGTLAVPVSLQLDEIDHIDQPTAQVQALTPQISATSQSDLQVNDRLVVWSLQDAKPYPNNYFLAWDRMQHRLVALGDLANPPAIYLSGHVLLLGEDAGDGKGAQLSLIDTSTLPG